MFCMMQEALLRCLDGMPCTQHKHCREDVFFGMLGTSPYFGAGRLYSASSCSRFG